MGRVAQMSRLTTLRLSIFFSVSVSIMFVRRLRPRALNSIYMLILVFVLVLFEQILEERSLFNGIHQTTSDEHDGPGNKYFCEIPILFRGKHAQTNIKFSYVREHG